MSDGGDPVRLREDASAPAEAGPTADAGPGNTLSALYRNHWGEIVAYIRMVCGPGPPEPEDAVQAAFAQFAGLEKPEAIENPRAFLYTTARHYVISEKRKLMVRKKHQLTIISRSETADQIDAGRVLEAKQRIQLLQGVLDQMDPRRREALLMLKLEGLTYLQISERMGVSQTWAKRLVADALIECNRAIQKAEGE